MDQEEKICQDHQKSAIQIDSNNKELTKMEIEDKLKNEIIKIERTIYELELEIFMDRYTYSENERENILNYIEKMNKQKIKLTNQLNGEKIINTNYKFRLLYSDPMNDYYSFVFNSDSTLLFAGGQKFIKIFKFKNGKKLLQKLTTPHGIIFRSINSLIFMNKSNQLVSGKGDQIIFWSQGKNNCWEPYQIIQDGDYCDIKFMIANEDEDLLILYVDWIRKISFWKKVNSDWRWYKSVSDIPGVVSLSLNKSQTKLLLCCFDQEIIIFDIREDDSSSMEYIQTNCDGYQLCWISDSEFVLQGKEQFLDVYQVDPSYQKLFDCSEQEKYYYYYVKGKDDFKIKKQIKVQNNEKFSPTFPCKYLESKGILIIQNGKFINFFGTIGGEISKLQQSIEFSDEQIFGNISNDGKFLVTLDRKRNNTMQIRRLEYLD